MKLIFAGTPQFAAVAFDALVDAGFEIALVLTQPDRNAGRGMQLRASEVKQRALARGVPLLQPATLRGAELLRQINEVGADAMVVAAYGLILPSAVLATPTHGCLNIHASLLPRWRGAAPIQRALLAGDAETGITIMQMDAGLDTGAILLQETTPIQDTDTAGTLHDRLAQMGARCIVRALQQPLPARVQDGSLATYADKISKSESQINWLLPAQEINRQVRAFNPVPGAVTLHDGHVLKIWRAQAVSSVAGQPGRVVSADRRIVVATGLGALAIEELQPAGGKRLMAEAFLAGHPMVPGTQLGT